MTDATHIEATARHGDAEFGDYFELLKPRVMSLVIFTALVGLIAARLLPLEKFPDIEFPGIFIQIPYDGSSPEEIERLITRPVEEALATLSGVERMSSTSTETSVFSRIYASPTSSRIFSLEE